MDLFGTHVKGFQDDFGPILAGLDPFEYAGPHRAQLWPVVRAQDGGHQIAAEGWAGPGHIAAFLIHI